MASSVNSKAMSTAVLQGLTKWTF